MTWCADPIAFIFLAGDSNTPSPAADAPTDGVRGTKRTASDLSTDEAASSSPTKAAKMQKVEVTDHLICPICQEVLHQPTAGAHSWLIFLGAAAF